MYFKFARTCGTLRFMNAIQKYNNKSFGLSSGEGIHTVPKHLHQDSPKSGYKRIISQTYNVVPQLKKTASEDERREYASFFPDLVKVLTEPHQHIPKVAKLYADILEGNVPNHQQAPGISVVTAYKKFESLENLTPDNIRLANILGWCIDMLVCSIQINDDIMDQSETRRGIPCWYKDENVGMRAANDAMLIENSLYILLKKYISGHDCYLPALEFLSEMTVLITLGQSLDLVITSNRNEEETFTTNTLTDLVYYKGGWVQYLLPLKLAMYLAGKYDTEQHRQLKKYAIEMGTYFIRQNEMLDCYGNFSITGKVGNDIREGKCTWLAVTAMQRATPDQKAIFKKHYGKPGIENEMEVRALYEKLNIFDAFLSYEKESFESICKQIEQMSKDLPQEYFLDCVKAVYGYGN